MTKAEEIMTMEYHDAIEAAETESIDITQRCDYETTIFTFADGSKLLFLGTDKWAEKPSS